MCFFSLFGVVFSLMSCEKRDQKPLTGEVLYQRYCQACHQADGQGRKGLYPPLAGSEWVSGTPEISIRIVLHGLKGPIKVKGEVYDNLMAPWGWAMDDQAVAALLDHIRNSWGNKGSPVDPLLVKSIRAENAGHSAWTEKELLDLSEGKLKK